MFPFILNILVLTLVITLVFIKSFKFYLGYRLAKKRSLFKCQMCGKCCRHFKISVSKSDEKRIQKHGYTDFAHKGYMKKKNGACIFLKKQGNIYKCSIHNIKPDACRNWPIRHSLGKTLIKPWFKCPAIKKLK